MGLNGDKLSKEEHTCERRHIELSQLFVLLYMYVIVRASNLANATAWYVTVPLSRAQPIRSCP